MNIEARKLSLVQEFLRVSDEEVIAKLEQVLRDERKKKLEKELSPMTMEEFYGMIDKSEDDIKAGRVSEARELLKKVDKWK
ncbi:hypothetical protein [Williamwhitmania taraxaci]|uniref:Uncharacterized protein n=1 Tax=Williamwhitmania taraxaci TaxID=1640674 RepID=A0A1G6MII6_9BACT|nr:hypothetical protein [Williamwhitmania taraxaci]SDC55047.1 hypothetical protein SAMN05216323_103614 [Williamwhitmania taraxaci]